MITAVEKAEQIWLELEECETHEDEIKVLAWWLTSQELVTRQACAKAVEEMDEPLCSCEAPGEAHDICMQVVTL